MSYNGYNYLSECQRSLQMRQELLEHLVQARALLFSHNITSDWDFGVPTVNSVNALRSVTHALKSLDWHRRDKPCEPEPERPRLVDLTDDLL